ncbi:secreted RxLR effector protein 161-like [Rhagoletis pomonella]|uniref:secreted RxLR effector protein 161-like n=1 Tax=Rhagoletis pomonella TaxID=28610 RepID=UPI00177DF1E8|nr:secreted RxLR effector protein 161-like [Rhagoletis pomonella]
MESCNPISTPFDLNQKLKKSDTIDETMKEVPYQQAIGSLLFAAQCTRPDICQAVNFLSRFNNNPNRIHWMAVKRIFRYLKGTLEMKLYFFARGNHEIVAYSDADWANDVNERRSVTGYVNILQNGAISWNSKRQPTAALSTSEAEYMAMSAATQEVVWLRGPEKDLNIKFDELLPTKVFCDNQSAIHIATNDAYQPRTKHIDKRHHFIREKNKMNEVSFCSISTDKIIADFLTKPVCFDKHKCKQIGLKII